ncbi:similar to hypothetical protein FLJ32658 (predicted), isoform CRA_a [Rattus norvegicus]|uniref:Uncharacterized protein RGD1561972_predicted n=1 Tax=Rattus norvegicus TaxID=10116 RepID=A6JAZ3_RAT|nr:similar to hypothetical protein FLJ32658 (predicted), isoform CRA_a [Rattus norvegicus]
MQRVWPRPWRSTEPPLRS